MKTPVQLYKEGNKWVMSSALNPSMHIAFNNREEAYRISKAWRFKLTRATHRDKKYMKSNQINIIKPYKHHEQWVFDDPSVGLEREAFVAGADTLLDIVTEDIPNAGDGIVVLFSAGKFPSYNVLLKWKHGDEDGNFYSCFRDNEQPVATHNSCEPLEAWLCPALFKYYEDAPKELYLQVKPLLQEDPIAD